MSHRVGFFEGLERSEPPRAAVAILEGALFRRSDDEHRDFWRAIEIFYISCKAPFETIMAPTEIGPPPRYPAAAPALL